MAAEDAVFCHEQAIRRLQHAAKLRPEEVWATNFEKLEPHLDR